MQLVKTEANIQAQLNKLEEVKLLPLDITGNNRALVNPFSGLVANDAQRHDLLNFRRIGKEMFEIRIRVCIFKTLSVKVLQCHK